MIRFCDKEVFMIHRGEVTRSELLSFFLKSEFNRTSVVIYLDEADNYYGMTTYKKVLGNYEEEQYICRDVLVADDEFWINAKEYFEDKEAEIRPVLNKSGDILGFYWDDKNIKDSFIKYLIMSLS